MRKKWVCLVLLATSLGPIFLQAQRNALQATVGPAFRFGKAASGFNVGITYTRNVSARGSLLLDLGVYNTQSDRFYPQGDNSQYIVRDYRNPKPQELSLFPWTKASFPGIHLPTQPSRYFNWDVALQCEHTLWQRGAQSLHAGGGGVLTFYDAKELVGFVQGDVRLVFPPRTLNQVYIPVFQYDTYLDAGLQGQIRYRYLFKSRVFLGVLVKNTWFPKSGTTLTALGTTIGFVL